MQQPAQLNIFTEDEPIANAPSDIDHAQIKRLAQAAEHLVCTHLLSEGLDVFLVGSASRPYDILVDTGNLYRFQVKCSLYKRTGGNGKHYPPHYRFGHVSRTQTGPQRENLGLLGYRGKIDAFAFVALDIRRIIYLHVSALKTKQLEFTQRDFLTKEKPSWEHLKSHLKI